jgi:hypothetical protein
LKFFTPAWVHADMTDAEAGEVSRAYGRHVEGLNLPKPVRDLANLNPHDAYILDVGHLPDARELHLRLRCGDLQVGYFDALLDFSGAAIRPDDVTVLLEARRPAAFEVLYDELDRAGIEDFEYRLLLHPVGEVAIVFRDVAVTQHRVSGRQG